MQAISDEAFNSLVKVMEGFMVLSIKFKISLRLVLQETVFLGEKRLLNISQTQHVLWFLCRGLAREITEDEPSQQEKTSWFWLEDSFLCVDPAFCAQEASEKGIQLLQDSKVVLISYLEWKLLKERFPEAETLMEKVRSHYARLRQHHLEDIKQLSTEQRYLKNKVLLDDLFGRVKLKYIAEYLGMADDTLGKLRKKFNRKR